jgi:hypothetical protein
VQAQGHCLREEEALVHFHLVADREELVVTHQALGHYLEEFFAGDLDVLGIEF